jgi:hypothetical protein
MTDEELVKQLRASNLEVIEDDYGVWPPEAALMRIAANRIEELVCDVKKYRDALCTIESKAYEVRRSVIFED